MSGLSEDGFNDLDPDSFEQIEQIDGVRGFWALAFVFVAAEEYPNYFSVAVVERRGEAPDYLTLEGTGAAGDLGPNDILVNEAMQDELDKGVGDTVVVNSLTSDQFFASLSGEDTGPPGGPTISARIAGVIRAAEEVSDAPDPFLIMSPAFYAKYRDTVGGCLCILELNVDPDKMAAVEAELAASFPDANIERTEDLGARLTDTISLQRAAWWAMAFAASVAGLIAVYYASREVADTLEADDDTQKALGMRGRDRHWSRLVVLTPSIIIGSASALGVAYALSPLSPVGVTRRAEPQPGLRWDAGILLPGLISVFIVSSAVTGIATRGVRRRTMSPWAWSGRGGPVRSLGARMAFGPGFGAVVGVVLATTGLVAAMTLESSIDHVLTTPSLYGADYDAVVGLSSGGDRQAVADQLETDPDVEAVGLIWTPVESGSQTPVTISAPGGSIGLEPTAFESRKGTVDMIPTAGRAPARSDEVAVGRAVLEALSAEVGDRITATGQDGSLDLTIVGITVEPANDTTDQGFTMRLDGLERLAPTAVKTVVARFGAGSAHDAVLARHADIYLRAVVPPSEVGNVGQLGGLPLGVGWFFAALGALALVNAAIQTVRRSRKELAIHRALGFTGAQVICAHLWQAVFTAAVGIVIGAGAGLVVGRAVVRSLMNSIGAVPVARVPGTVWAVGAGCVVACLLAGSIATTVALRRHSSAALRVE